MKFWFAIFLFLLTTIVFVAFLFVSSTFAHPGNTDGNGCHQCVSCTPYGSLYQWDGMLYEYYHCHKATIGPGENQYEEQDESLVIPSIIPHSDPQPIVVPPANPVRPLPTIDTSWYEQLEKEREQRGAERQRQIEENKKWWDDYFKKLEEAGSKIPKETPKIQRTARPTLHLSTASSLFKSEALQVSSTSSTPSPNLIFDSPKKPSPSKNIIFRIFDWIINLILSV